MPTKPSTANPTYPVFGENEKKALADGSIPFEVVKVGSFNSPKYGPTWRLTIARLDTGEMALLLLAANDVRDDVFGQYASITSAGDTVGPCILTHRKLANGRTTWEIADAPEPETAAKK